MATLLCVSEVIAAYGHITALKNISLTVNAGEIVALIGANGAGKTTTLKVISGIVSGQSGTIQFDGANIGAWAPDRRVALGIAHVPEGRHIFPRLSVLENLQMGGYTRTHALRSALEETWALFPVLAERRAQMGGTLSGGEQQMLAIGRALMSRPKLLLLDEPSLGLSPLMSERIFEMIRTINRMGKTILMVEQNARAALALAQRGYVMQTGQMVLTGTTRDLIENPEVQSAYLGTEG